jgi:hypothetical protein
MLLTSHHIFNKHTIVNMFYSKWTSHHISHSRHYIPDITFQTLHSRHHIPDITFQTLHSRHHIPDITFQALHSRHYIPGITFQASHSRHHIPGITFDMRLLWEIHSSRTINDSIYLLLLYLFIVCKCME